MIEVYSAIQEKTKKFFFSLTVPVPTEPQLPQAILKKINTQKFIHVFFFFFCLRGKAILHTLNYITVFND